MPSVPMALKAEIVETAFVQISLFHKTFTSNIHLEINGTACVEAGLCAAPDSDSLLALSSTSPLQLIEAFKDTFSTAWKDSEYYWLTLNNNNGGDAANNAPMEFFPSLAHQVDREKLIVVFGFYLILAIILLLLYRFRKRLSVEYDFKLSTLSKLIFHYLVVKLISTIVYFVFLIIFTKGIMRDFLFLKPYLIDFFTIWNYLLSVASFGLVVLFSLGYGTRYFAIDTKMKIKTAILTTLYFFQTFTSLIHELDEIRLFWLREYNTYHKVSIGVVFVGIVITVIYFGLKTYNTNKDKRFIQSAFLIFGAFALNPFIVIPDGGVSNIFVDNVVGAGRRGVYGLGKHIPEILEVLVLTGLIYIWRDVKEEEQDWSIVMQPVSTPASETA